MVISGTHDAREQNLVIEDGEEYEVRGTVRGNVEVADGGVLIHRGLITGAVTVYSGGIADIAGRIEGPLYPDSGARVTVDEEEQAAGEYWGEGVQVSAAPAGWGAVHREWAQCVLGIDRLVEEASLEQFIQTRHGDTTDDAFWAIAAVIAAAGDHLIADGTRDARLWALLSAAVFNRNPDFRIRNRGQRDIWSPEDCREKLPWGELRTYFELLPEFLGLPSLAEELLKPEGRDEVRSEPAEVYCNVVGSLVNAVLDVGAELPDDYAAIGSQTHWRQIIKNVAEGWKEWEE
jgi:hypothetical protein